MHDFLTSDAVVRKFLFDLTDYAIIVLDEGGHVVVWSEGARALKGYRADEIIDHHFSRFYPREAVELGHPERELAVAASTGRYEEEGWRVRKDGTRFWAHVVISAIRDNAGCVRGFGKLVSDITEKKQATDQLSSSLRLLELSARTDYLTSLDNRRSFDSQYAREMAAARRNGRPLCIAMLDLDHFKDYNDSFGHQAGDAMLKSSAAAWRTALRTNDFIARYGGEEFVVIMPETVIADGLLVLERLRRATPAPLTCSAGLAQWDAAETSNALLGRADGLLYAAKEAGRDRVVG